MTSADELRVRELHEHFIIANTHEDVDFLRQNSTADVSWYNLNKSNYMSQEEILALWEMLYRARPDKSKDAVLTVTDLVIKVVGDVAWATYLVHVDYDFGDLARVQLGARSTEIWCRETDEGWKLAHFHCSEHEAGHMGGR